MIDLGLENEVNFILESIKSELKADEDNLAELQEK